MASTKNIEAIVQVPGLDAVFVGPNDLAASLGRIGELTHPSVSAAIDRVTQVCQSAHMPLGIFGASAEAVTRSSRRMSMAFIPDVVWFGEALPPAALEAAAQAARACDVFFSIGTSGLVEPAASFARIALQHGAAVVEVNPTVTSLTSRATFALQGASGEILPALVKAV